MRFGSVVGVFLLCAPALAQTQGQRPQSQQAMQRPQYLPKDAQLVGVSEATELRTFPEQSGKTGQASPKVQKEDVVGAAALDRVWTTKQSYQQTTKDLDQAFQRQGSETLVKTTTQGATAWNVKMPDGHIANVVVRNTQPTTIESVQLAGAETTVQPGNQANPQQPAPRNQ